jgi:hypothetical protein
MYQLILSRFFSNKENQLIFISIFITLYISFKKNLDTFTEEMEDYVFNHNRLTSVLSKTGPLTETSDFSQITRDLIDDALHDYLKDNDSNEKKIKDSMYRDFQRILEWVKNT